MDDFAVILRALELRASGQEADVGELQSASDSLLAEAQVERQAFAEIEFDLTGTVSPTVPSPIRRFREGRGPPPSWDDALAEARILLGDKGENPEICRLPRSQHELDVGDVLAALAFGAIGATVPSLGGQHGSVQDGLKHIQSLADGGQLPERVQAVFGDHPAPFMDVGASGIYHRYYDGHDLVSALPEGIRRGGLLPGALGVFQHLLTDSFGRTGIPLPGSTELGNAFAGSQGLDSVRDVISGRDLARYSGVRLADGVATGTTALLLWLYSHARDIPEASMRRPKLAILAHGLCTIGVVLATLVPGLRMAFPYRSHINYVSLMAVAKNAYQLRRMTSALRHENDQGFASIERELAALKQMDVMNAGAIETEFSVAANVLAFEPAEG